MLLHQPHRPGTDLLIDHFRHDCILSNSKGCGIKPGALHRATPAAAYAARPKASPGTDRSRETHDRVRTDKIDRVGTVTLRHNGRLHHIGVGRPHAGTYVLLLVQDLEIRIIYAATGELLRELTLDTTKRYQGTGRPPGPPPKKQ